MPSPYRLAGALQWGCTAYYLLAGVGTLATQAFGVRAHLAPAFSPLALLWLLALLGGYLYVRERERDGRISRRGHARRVESLTGVLLFTLAGTVGVRMFRFSLRSVGRPVPFDVRTVALTHAAVSLLGVAVAFALAYVVDVRWLYGADAADPQ